MRQMSGIILDHLYYRQLIDAGILKSLDGVEESRESTRVLLHDALRQTCSWIGKTD